jgi:hypothetical protein
MPLSCFLCGQLLRTGTRRFTLIATLLAPVAETASRRVARHKQVSVCGHCFVEIEPAKPAAQNEG